MDCIIFDIDGTLADCTHRLHHIAGAHKNYDAFFSKAHLDVPILPIIRLCQTLHDEGQMIVFVSGRPDNLRTVTENWLWEYVGFNGPLFMRREGDRRPDYVVKCEILEYDLRRNGLEPWLAIDDRPQVIEKCWRAEGIKTLAADWHGDTETILKPPARVPHLHLMVGPSGAGKSTLIEDRSWNLSFTVLSSDEFRHGICGDFKDQSRNEEVFARLHETAKALLWSGHSVVIDATNIRDADRKKFLDLAPPNAVIHYHIINRSMEAKRRDGGWRNELGFDLLEKHEQTFRSNLKAILSGDGDPRVKVYDLREQKNA